ncbi:MAG: CARDB domain-containing protein [Thermoplasmata archaeon]|jgi:CARDB protein
MVAHPEVDPAVKLRSLAVVALILVLLAPTFLATVGALAPEARAAGTSSVTGSITGPTLVATQSTTQYEIHGSGGPAVAANGTIVGTIAYYTTLLATNLTGVSLSPPSANFTFNSSIAAHLAVGNASETITIDVMISSVYQGTNESTNFTYTVTVVQPYVVTATIVDSSSSTVTGFTVFVTLDGTVIGNVTVPSLQVGGSYQVTFDYPTTGLTAGDHTFAISLVQEHGLVMFANGQTTYAQTVYVTGPATDYTLWYVAGIVAFLGAIFIFASRVAARRRGASRR